AHFRRVLPDALVDLSRHDLVVDMGGFVTVSQHLQPRYLVIQPPGLIGLPESFARRPGLDPLVLQYPFQGLPQQLDRKLKALDGAVDGQWIGVRFAQRLVQPAQRPAEAGHALAKFSFAHTPSPRGRESPCVARRTRAQDGRRLSSTTCPALRWQNTALAIGARRHRAPPRPSRCQIAPRPRPAHASRTQGPASPTDTLGSTRAGPTGL